MQSRILTCTLTIWVSSESELESDMMRPLLTCKGDLFPRDFVFCDEDGVDLLPERSRKRLRRASAAYTQTKNVVIYYKTVTWLPNKAKTYMDNSIGQIFCGRGPGPGQG